MTCLANKLSYVSSLIFITLAGFTCGLYQDESEEWEHAMPQSHVASITSGGKTLISTAKASEASGFDGYTQYADKQGWVYGVTDRSSHNCGKTVQQCLDWCSADSNCAGISRNTGDQCCYKYTSCDPSKFIDGAMDMYVKVQTYYKSTGTQACQKPITTLSECQAAATRLNGKWDGERSWTDRCYGCLWTVSGGDVNFNSNQGGRCENKDQVAVCQQVGSTSAASEACAPRETLTNMNSWYPDRDADADDCTWLCANQGREAWCLDRGFTTSDGGTCKLYDCALEACSAGQIQSNSAKLFGSSDNSKTACQNKCEATPGCIAFDYTTVAKVDSCRGVQSGQTPRLGDPGSDNREFCPLSQAQGTEDNCMKPLDDEQCEVCDNNMYLSFGDCLPQCPPGSLEHGRDKTGRECKECDGEIHGAAPSKECRPCPDGHIAKENSDACQNVQDTCSEVDCEGCLSCMNKLQPGLEACWGQRPPESSCVDFDQLWCPEFMEAFGECEHISVGCYHKLLCHEPKVCPEWKKVRCGGSVTHVLLQANASEKAASASLAQRSKGTARVMDGHSLDSAMQGKCQA